MSAELWGGQTVMTRVGTIGLIATLCAPLGAQQMMTVSSQSQENALKTNVTTFELALRQSVMSAGNTLAQWAGQVAPGVTMVFADLPTVRSVPLMDNSLVFHVEVSPILPTSNSLFQSLQQKPQTGGARVGANSAMGSPEAVASGKSPDSLPPITMSPDQYYTSLVHDALVNTILDSSGVLPLREGQTLTVACNPVEGASPILRPTSRQLVLQIKGEDVLAYHAKTITRDEAKRRIVERRF